ncbi:MAG: hypothetical protein L0210_05910, partial [Rhodospirillales bacterium]|nr:hypothetical protein [Rhodospirillales bacterium]
MLGACSNPLTANGTTVTSFAADLPTGKFTCSAAFDTESRLYIDVTGLTASGRLGAMLQRIAQNGGIATADIDTGGLDLVEADRAVALGLQVLGGSIREALDRVAASAFLDWFHHARE